MHMTVTVFLFSLSCPTLVPNSKKPVRYSFFPTRPSRYSRPLHYISFFSSQSYSSFFFFCFSCPFYHVFIYISFIFIILAKCFLFSTSFVLCFIAIEKSFINCSREAPARKRRNPLFYRCIPRNTIFHSILSYYELFSYVLILCYANKSIYYYYYSFIVFGKLHDGVCCCSWFTLFTMNRHHININ